MQYLTTRQVCTVLSISRWKVADLIAQGELRAIKGGDAPNSHVKIEEDSVTEYVDRHRVQASA